jgi:phage baseplate assembly protein W
MSANPRLYDKIVLPGNKTSQNTPGSKTYKGFSTVSSEATSFSLYDLELIKQDLINHFHVRQGERLENPTFGTIIWDMLFEPLTDDLRELIAQNVEEIINYDPRIKADQVIVTQYESGIQIECKLMYLPYYITEAIQLRFDQANGIVTSPV